MHLALLILIVLVLLGAVIALGLFVRWLSRGWTVVAEDDATAGGHGLWQGLKNLFGRGQPRLTYRRDTKGRFRKYRR